MPDGRELDALISELVMGRPVLHREWPCAYGRHDYRAYHSVEKTADGWAAAWGETFDLGPVVAPDSSHWIGDTTWPPELNVYANWEIMKAKQEGTVLPNIYYATVFPVPFYHRELEAAWTLVPHLPYFSLYRRTSPGYPELWQCQSRFCGDGLDHSSANCSCVAANAETAALAICRAAVML